LRARFEKQDEENYHLSLEYKGELENIIIGGKVMFDEMASLHSTIKIGGIVDAFVKISSTDELKKILVWATERKIDYHFVGSMGKTIVKHAGMYGILATLGDEFSFIDIESEDDETIKIHVGASTMVEELVNWLKNRGIGGADWLLNFGGTAGGCAIANVSHEGKSFEDFLNEITIVTKESKELTVRKKSLRFSGGKLKVPSTSCITRLLLSIKKNGGNKGLLSNGDFEKNVLKRVFLNSDNLKAEDLIADAALMGVRVGGARVASNCLNSIVNEGNASSRDFSILINLIRDKVKQYSGISLECAVTFLGNDVE